MKCFLIENDRLVELPSWAILISHFSERKKGGKLQLAEKSYQKIQSFIE